MVESGDQTADGVSVEELLAESLRFETLMCELSAAIIAATAAEVDAQLAVWLGRIVEALNIDRATLMQLEGEPQRLRITHFASRKSSGMSAPEVDVGRELPWYCEQVLQGQRILWTRLPEQLPIDAIDERSYCQRLSLRSHLLIPLKVGGLLVGALSCSVFHEDRDWPALLIRRVELLGQLFANAMCRMHGTALEAKERQRAEEAARGKQLMYERLVETIDGIVWQLDIATFKFTFVSPQAERILGYPVSQWLSEPDFWSRHIHEPDRTWAAEYCLRATTEMRDHEFHYRMIAADGRIVWLHDVVTVVVENGRASQLRGIMVDITERKKVEQALRESESHFRAMFDEAPIGLAYIDATLHLSRVNHALCNFLGYSEEELTGVPFAEITHPDDIDRDLQLAEDVFRGKIPSYQMEKRYLKKSGEIIWGLLTATIIRDRDGNIVCGLGMIENITGRKEVEDQLRQAQKMDALGQLAGGVAHDFNNLLTAIKGYTEITLSELPKDHSLRANLEEVIKAGDRATALTRQLLAFGRKQVRRPKIIDLSSVVDDMQKMLRRLIGENIKLVTSVESRLGKVLADPSQIEQIVVNLVVNARDAMPRGGKLMIDLATVYLDQEYARQHISVTPGRHVMLAVSDTGCGMSRAVQQRIFEPFFTTKAPGQGTGLGLPTVYGIVKQSGGHIWVYSEEGTGTKFKIYLPCVDGSDPLEDAAVALPDSPGGSETILLVEDDDSVRNMVVRILRDKGYKLLVARDGQEAATLCEQDTADFQLLLTDVIMPQMGGRELSDKLRPRRPKMKVLYISGYAHDAMMHHGVLDEGVALLEKPFTKDELLRRIREVLSSP
jgi:two-component system cell cycle sensor histidine kinase/response regulator CckA